MTALLVVGIGLAVIAIETVLVVGFMWTADKLDERKVES
jgi:hypothetical protein